MKLKRTIYNELLNSCPDNPVEVGGILGSADGVVMTYMFDNGKSEYGKYSPNVNFINNTMCLWDEQGIDFAGMFHSHYPSGKNLSYADKEYIKAIMLSIGDNYSFLYFPIVIPKKEIISYKAELKNEKVIISFDKIYIID